MTDQEDGAYPCPKCPKRFNSQGHWKIHMTLHGNPTLYQCSICNKNFATSFALKCHIMTHTGLKPFPCPKCSMSFAQKANMKKHLVTHLNIRAFPCHICDKAFTRKAHLQAHVTSIHDKRKDHVCSICDMKFARLDAKTKHHKTHLKPGERKLHCCHYCRRSFCRLSALQNHLRVHTREKPFKCIAPKCRRGFLNQDRLKTHLARSHGQKQSTILKDCIFCGRLFSKTSTLEAHMLTHTTERPFPCGVDTCKWMFRTKHSRKRHILNCHGNVDPYSESRATLAENHFVDNKPNLDPVKMEPADDASPEPDHRIPPGSSRVMKQHLKCVFCGVIYSKKIELFAHMNSEHGANIEFKTKTPRKYTTKKKEKCYFCHQSLTLPSLSNHITRHTMEVQERCEGCGKKCAHMPQLRSHWTKSCTTLSTQPKKTYPCKFCHKIYRVWKSLVNHMRKIHLGEDANNPIECFNRCGLTFSTILERDQHMEMYHKKDTKCPQVGCEEVFYTKRLLNFHLLKFHKNEGIKQCHRNSKKCLICMVSFQTLDDVNSHFGKVHKSNDKDAITI